MTDFQLVDPQGWELDLQSIYSAYLNHFQLHGIAWYDRTWGHLFTSFEAFLAFGWPTIVVTDAVTGRGHIVTRMNSVGAFLKMIKTRFGENLTIVDNILYITPFETHARHLRTITDSTSYKRVYATLPATTLAAQKQRVKSGDPKWVGELWEKKDKTFLALGFVWSERNPGTFLEWGYAAVRCGHLHAMGVWPPVPATNYRKGHYVVAEYLDKVRNRLIPNYPREFGDSQVVSKATCIDIIQATITSLASPDSETIPNQLVLVVHGTESGGDIDRITSNLKIKVPHNILTIDTASLEKNLFAQGLRQGDMLDQASRQRQRGSTLPLSATLRSLLHADPGWRWHCSGNDAFSTLLTLQLLFRECPDSPLPPPPPPPPSPHLAIPAASAAKRTKSLNSLRVRVPLRGEGTLMMSSTRTPTGTEYLSPTVCSSLNRRKSSPRSHSGSAYGGAFGAAPRSEIGSMGDRSGAATKPKTVGGSSSIDQHGNTDARTLGDSSTTTSTTVSQSHSTKPRSRIAQQFEKTVLRTQSSFGTFRNGFLSR